MRSVLLIAAVVLLASCETPVVATATEQALCDILGERLPSRSHEDTGQTQEEIGLLWAEWERQCD